MSAKVFIHSSSVIEKNAKVGFGTRIWCYTHILAGAIIGKNCNIGQNVFIDSDVKIGNSVKIQNNVSVYRGITLEDGVFCGPSCVFTNVINPRSLHPRAKSEYKATHVRKGATIGANATIICGHTMGRFCFIGAGAVVTRDVPDYALVIGNPARQRGWICECGEKLDFSAGEKTICKKCHISYLIKSGKVIRRKE